MNSLLPIQLDEADYLTAQALHSKLSRNWIAIFWLAMLALAAVTVWVLTYGRESLSSGEMAGLVGGTLGGLIGGVVGGLVVRYFYVPWKHKRIFRQQTSLHLPFRFSWSNEEIVSENERGSIKTKWSEIVKWKENDQLFLLYISDVMFLIFPKRAFPDQHELSRFQDALNGRAATVT